MARFMGTLPCHELHSVMICYAGHLKEEILPSKFVLLHTYNI